jgi:hypothetical protein
MASRLLKRAPRRPGGGSPARCGWTVNVGSRLGPLAPTRRESAEAGRSERSRRLASEEAVL